MAEIIFIFNQNPTIIQCTKEESLKVVIERF